MANPLMNILGSVAGGTGDKGVLTKIIGSVAGAMLRGESPMEYLQNLAKTSPALQGLDFSDINGVARKLCQERGIDADKLAEEIKSKLPTGQG